MTEVTDQFTTQLTYIYANYRTALLNKKYYGEMLYRSQRINFFMEIALGIGTTGSVGGLALWGTEIGKIAWLVISSTSAILAVAKPVLQIGQQIEKYTKLYTGHTNNYLELKAVVEEIAVLQSISGKVKDRYASIGRLIRELGGLEDPRQRRKLILKIEGDVNREIPPESLWMPPENDMRTESVGSQITR
jgi:hypothetical protein